MTAAAKFDHIFVSVSLYSLGVAVLIRVRLEKGNYPTIRASPNSQRRFLISVCSSMKGKG